MSIQMIINNLSSNELSQNEYEATEKMEILLKTYVDAIRLGMSRDVIITKDFNGLELSNGYFVYNWRNNLKSNPEKRHLIQLFNSFINRTQYINEIDDTDKEFILQNGTKSKTLLKCYVDQHIALSFNCKEFSMTKILGTYCYIDYQQNILEEAVTIFNASHSEHLDDMETNKFIESVKLHHRLEFTNYEDFWARKEFAFPTLLFCQDIYKQIQKIEKTLLIDNVKLLIKLERYFSSWNWKEFNYNNISNTTPESEQTLKAYKKEHTFTTPFDEEIIVSYHIKGAAFDTRVYFHLDYKHKKIIICSVGEHLPCIRYGLR